MAVMDEWLIWVLTGGALMLLELLLPGAITIFVGMAAMLVGAGIKYGYLETPYSIIICFILSTLFFLIVVRTIFLRFFKGDETIHNVDENKDVVGSIVLVEEEIQPYKEGRVHFRGTTWQARSDDTILKSSNAIILRFDGNVLVVKSIEE
jgi:membrane protein implicated in regulation of membrane protease activity